MYIRTKEAFLHWKYSGAFRQRLERRRETPRRLHVDALRQRVQVDAFAQHLRHLRVSMGVELEALRRVGARRLDARRRPAQRRRIAAQDQRNGRACRQPGTGRTPRLPGWPRLLG